MIKIGDSVAIKEIITSLKGFYGVIRLNSERIIFVPIENSLITGYCLNESNHAFFETEFGFIDTKRLVNKKDLKGELEIVKKLMYIEHNIKPVCVDVKETGAFEITVKFNS